MTDPEPSPVKLEGREVRRVEVLSIVFAILGGLALTLARGWLDGLVLTLLAGLSIVNFRALQLQVLLLEPRTDGRLGSRNGLLILLRLTFLGVLVFGALVLGSRHLLALILGLAVVPAALMTEALLRVAGRCLFPHGWRVRSIAGARSNA